MKNTENENKFLACLSHLRHLSKMGFGECFGETQLCCKFGAFSHVVTESVVVMKAL